MPRAQWEVVVVPSHELVSLLTLPWRQELEREIAEMHRREMAVMKIQVGVGLGLGSQMAVMKIRQR